MEANMFHIQIIGVKFEENSSGHEHIKYYKWLDTENKKTGVSIRAKMVDFINANPDTVFVKDEKGSVEVFVVDVKPPYLRTKAPDDEFTDNLLSLPTF